MPQEEDQNRSVAADLVVGVERVVGQHVADKTAGIQRRNRKQIEEDQSQVDFNRQKGQQSQGLWGRDG